ncbi:hypothetical protein ACRQ1B_21630 [Rhizobium panacihumi]|uniref:hypothetical protein n=1 Tax=Rhizobium panacihumi TaxID=2008450 RepID=UPI003D7B934C
MATDDLSEYEQTRARLHEVQCRLTAAMVNVRQGFCHRRACRRNRYCIGPMLPSPHQEGVVKLHKELGLSGKANADLPACMAFQQKDIVDLFKRTMDKVGTMQGTLSDSEILRLSLRHLRDRGEIGIYAHLTSFADHPTSVAKETALKTADEKGKTP